MKQLVLRILRRNALVGLVFLLLLTSLRFVGAGSDLLPLLLLAVFLGSLFWANRIPTYPGRTILLMIPAISILGFTAFVGSMVLCWRLAEWQYRAQGFQLIEGCNGAAANSAEFDVYKLGDRLTDLKTGSTIESNQIAQLQKLLPLAQERVRLLDADCRKRGHRDTRLWRPEWAAIKQALTEPDQGPGLPVVAVPSEVPNLTSFY